MSVTTQAVHHMQRDVRNQKQDSSIQIAILTIPLQSSAIQGEDLVEGYKELERGMKKGILPTSNNVQSHNPYAIPQS